MKLPNLKGKTANIKPQKHFLLKFMSVQRGGGISFRVCRLKSTSPHLCPSPAKTPCPALATPTVLSAVLLEPSREAPFLVATN